MVSYFIEMLQDFLPCGIRSGFSKARDWYYFFFPWFVLNFFSSCSMAVSETNPLPTQRSASEVLLRKWANSSGFLSNLVHDISTVIIAIGFVPSVEPAGFHVGTVNRNEQKERGDYRRQRSGLRITFVNYVQPTSWKILIMRSHCYDPHSATLYPYTHTHTQQGPAEGTVV